MKVKYTNPDLNTMPQLLKLGYSSETDFHLEIETTYIVYGVTMWKSVLHFLVIPAKASLPNWYPAGVFEVVDGRIPPGWHFIHFEEDNPDERKFLLGYKELTQDATHYVGLIERDINAIRVFNMRREEIQNAFLD